MKIDERSTRNALLVVGPSVTTTWRFYHVFTKPCKYHDLVNQASWKINELPRVANRAVALFFPAWCDHCMLARSKSEWIQMDPNGVGTRCSMIHHQEEERLKKERQEKENMRRCTRLHLLPGAEHQMSLTSFYIKSYNYFWATGKIIVILI